MALLFLETPEIPKLTGKYLNFDFYIFDISFTDIEEYQPKEIQEQYLDKIKEKLECVKDRVLLLNLSYCRVVNKSFINTFKNLTIFGLYEVPLKVINNVLNILKDSSLNLKKLSFSLVAKEDPDQSEEKDDKKVTKFSMPSLVSLGLGKFNSSIFMEMFDFSSIRTLKLGKCIINDLPISDTIENLKITSCSKYTKDAIKKVTELKNLKFLKIISCDKSLVSEFMKILSELKSLRKICIKGVMSDEIFINCLLKDNIQEIDFSDNSLVFFDAKYVKAIPCSLYATTAKKLHFDRCTLNPEILNTLRECSKWIEYISLREINFNKYAIKSLEDLIRYSEFRVCDLRFIDDKYITSPIMNSNIDNIIIDYRPNITQKFSKLIELGKAIPMKKDVEIGYINIFPTIEYKNFITLNNSFLKVTKYFKYFRVHYIDTSDSMRANLREIIFPFNFYRHDEEVTDDEKNTEEKTEENTKEKTEENTKEKTEENTKEKTEEKTEANTSDTEESERDIINVIEMYMRIKLPPNRNIIIPPKPDHNTEVKSDYDFTIIIHTKDGSQSKETKIPCHKSVLSSKSEMFRKMFSVQMKENLLNEMVTDNIYYKDFIEYLYTNKLSLNKENIIPLVELAKMHFVKDLEYKIIAYIYKNQVELEKSILEEYDLII
jgi:hypothetical protein